jgi:hypothetical protein
VRSEKLISHRWRRDDAGYRDVIVSVAVGFLWDMSPQWAMTFVILTSVAGAIMIASTNPPTVTGSA